ncbi:MAG: hypothetical protein NT045_06790 [Candidatus Aureabacteria bacterium]|nr:hypothetical protein [Candidatus Auribacterota bacterium]
MNGRRIALLALILTVVVLCGCAGYFHYHPVKSIEEEKAGALGTKLFGEAATAPASPAISAAPATEESLIK